LRYRFRLAQTRKDAVSEVSGSVWSKGLR